MDFYAVLTDFESTLEPKILAFVDAILPSVRLLAVAIMVVFVGYHVIKSWLGENEKLDVSTLVRPCLILAALVLYTELVVLLIEKPVEIVNEIVLDGATKVGGATPGSMKLFRDKMAYTQDTGGVDGGGVDDVIQLHPFLELIHLIVFFIASVAGGYILFRQLIVKCIYLIIGPFVLAFSLIVGNEKVIGSWYQGFISVLLWLPMLSIVQTIIILLPVETTSFSDSDIIFSMAMQVVMIFVVFKVPRYANILVGQGAEMGSQAGNTIMGQVKGFPMSVLNNRMMGRSMKGKK
ncbi:hypothetical protein [Zobellia galactanivorans]|uniref:hypothetical protein n=1 Tax=Zobellia galactanivorans (strain DSM 12802 / CCUG 47099 / CIP 106680 / NCIMB 13871 / Dsij) TaxID=63186 RepID=UPI001C077B8C|nr:hypothetical protein [Zobellia galactanivorans]MBU3027530.1 hypothetical protein [Zobellia galactanivorans]